MVDVELPGQNKLFINKSLSPYYKIIWAKSKKSRQNSVFILGDTIKIRAIENISLLSLTHADDFGK